MDEAKQQLYDYDAIHQAVLAGLLGNIGMKADGFEYAGASGKRFAIFPGSGLFKKNPKWVVAAEIVQTSRLYARTVARIQPQWIEPLAEHLVKRTYSEPRWDAKTAQIVADEKVTLYGLEIVPKRAASFGPANPKLAREMFIHHALVEGEYACKAPFVNHNRQLIETIQSLEAKRRKQDLLADSNARYAFFDARLPEGIYSGILFEGWRREAERKNPNVLFMCMADLMKGEAAINPDLFPDVIHVENIRVALEYGFGADAKHDGVTAVIPLKVLNQIPSDRFEWIVPGWLEEKAAELIRTLPKDVRVKLVPAPDFARAALKNMGDSPRHMGLLDYLARELGKLSGASIRAEDFVSSDLANHLRMNFRVVDEAGKTLATGRDLNRLRSELGVEMRSRFAQMRESKFHRDDVKAWDFGDLPQRVEIQERGATLIGYPALVDEAGIVNLRVMETPDIAAAAMRSGLQRLLMIALSADLKYLEKNLPGSAGMSLNFATLGNGQKLKADLLQLIVARAMGEGPCEVRTRGQFDELSTQVRHRLFATSDESCAVVEKVLAEFQAVMKLLSGPIAGPMKLAAVDVRKQLGQLVHKDFLSTTPWESLRQVPRYLKAMQIRLGRSGPAAARDAQSSAQISALWEKYEKRREEHRKKKIADPALEKYRWMIEEMRVSLFAQELKTAVPVSVPRLEKLWEDVKR